MIAAIDITTEQRKMLLKFLCRFIPGVAVWAYGSRVKWTARPNSDLDLAAFTSPTQRQRVSELKEALDESDLPFLVDLHVWDEVPERFREIIRKEYVVLQEAKPPKTSSGRAAEWRNVTVGAIASSVRNALVGGPFGSNLVSRDYVEHGVPIIRGQNMGGRWIGGEFAYVTPAKAEALEANLARSGDIVFTQRGTLGQVSLVPDEPYERYLVSQSQMKLTVDRETAVPLFLYYVFRSEEQQDYIRQHAIQTGVPHTNLGILRDTPVPLPPIDEQRAIARILGTLDDKIELNRRMNETLEAMARSLFKSWFVDFDPVRAKAVGRDPGLPKPLSDLFPARLVDSELGEIPEGWEVKKLGDLLELAYGKALKAEDRLNGNIPVYGSNGQVGWHDQRLVAGPGIVVGRKGNPGIATWVPTDFFPIDTTFYVVPKSNCQSLEFLFHVLRTHDLASLGADSAVPGLNRNLAYMSAQVLPPASLLAQFERLASALSRRVSRGNGEARTLTDLRDTLLPKLISGELPVKDTEKFIGRAA